MPAAASPAGDVAPGYFPVLRDFHGRLDDMSGFGVALTTQDGTSSPSSPGKPFRGSCWPLSSRAAVIRSLYGQP